jgi:hypothetical protein
VPNTQATHWLILRPRITRRAQFRRGFALNLGAGNGKNKDQRGCERATNQHRLALGLIL